MPNGQAISFNWISLHWNWNLLGIDLDSNSITWLKYSESEIVKGVSCLCRSIDLIRYNRYKLNWNLTMLKNKILITTNSDFKYLHQAGKNCLTAKHILQFLSNALFKASVQIAIQITCKISKYGENIDLTASCRNFTMDYSNLNG